jgi:hypothetical protein
VCVCVCAAWSSTCKEEHSLTVVGNGADVNVQTEEG